MKIRKAIIPVAGMGTRFLPATKAQPKEMLTLVDKPVIQYIVEEAVAAGIEEIIFVTSIGKRAIEDHFDRNFELEYRLEQQNKGKELEAVSRIGKLAKFAFVRQAKPLGDGHAILSALPFVEQHEPVAVFFGDDVIEAKKPAIGQMMEVYEKYQTPVIGTFAIPRENVFRYGVIKGLRLSPTVWKVEGLVEKPSVRKAPSNVVISGRHIITPALMDFLKKEKPDAGGEIRLSNACASYLKAKKDLYAAVIQGTWYDCGSRLGFLEATVALALKHPEVKDEFAKYLKDLKI
ncbi:MAG: UTP--glucose-1-phosphate uridylyltransferase [bacterium]|nr:UTP--glucose-1-phosphate uridylyltransferase [bacterium]